MKTIIHQPYFLPWMGYFSKMPYANYFVVLDNVPFSKGFYIDRTKYISNNGETKWLSIPIGNQTNSIISSIIIKENDFIDKFLTTLYNSYRKAEHFTEEWSKLDYLIRNSFENNERLIDINISIIKGICILLDLKTPKFIKASEFGDYNDKTTRIIEICKKTNSKSIIMGDGSSLKIHDWERIMKSNINVEIQNFYGKHPVYKQVRRQRLKFAKGVSIIDSILNIGSQKTLAIINSSKYQPLTLNLNKNV
jgi:hypothetical protein